MRKNGYKIIFFWTQRVKWRLQTHCLIFWLKKDVALAAVVFHERPTTLSIDTLEHDPDRPLIDPSARSQRVRNSAVPTYTIVDSEVGWVLVSPATLKDVPIVPARECIEGRLDRLRFVAFTMDREKSAASMPHAGVLIVHAIVTAYPHHERS